MNLKLKNSIDKEKRKKGKRRVEELTKESFLQDILELKYNRKKLKNGSNNQLNKSIFDFDILGRI